VHILAGALYSSIAKNIEIEIEIMYEYAGWYRLWESMCERWFDLLGRAVFVHPGCCALVDVAGFCPQECQEKKNKI
jgi:TRAP-type mannitol/chloroaromatic compound transport system permease small subunit